MTLQSNEFPWKAAACRAEHMVLNALAWNLGAAAPRQRVGDNPLHLSIH